MLAIEQSLVEKLKKEQETIFGPLESGKSSIHNMYHARKTVTQ